MKKIHKLAMYKKKKMTKSKKYSRKKKKKSKINYKTFWTFARKEKNQAMLKKFEGDSYKNTTISKSKTMKAW